MTDEPRETTPPERWQPCFDVRITADVLTSQWLRGWMGPETVTAMREAVRSTVEEHHCAHLRRCLTAMLPEAVRPREVR